MLKKYLYLDYNQAASEKGAGDHVCKDSYCRR